MMKKSIIIIIIVLVFTTGCTCEYNLKINDNVYSETVKITAETNDETNQLNREWTVPIDKEKYIEERRTNKIDFEKYDYELNNNILTFKHDFDIESIEKSSAVSNCYDKLTVQRYDDKLIIATSTLLKCFDSFPPLNSLIISIETDKNVIDHNADTVYPGKYIWYFKRGNSTKKPINITLDNATKKEAPTESNNTDNNNINNNNEKKDNNNSINYTLYIFCGILLIVMLLAYYLFNKVKKKNEEIED